MFLKDFYVGTKKNIFGHGLWTENVNFEHENAIAVTLLNGKSYKKDG